MWIRHASAGNLESPNLQYSFVNVSRKLTQLLELFVVSARACLRGLHLYPRQHLHSREPSDVTIPLLIQANATQSMSLSQLQIHLFIR